MPVVQYPFIDIAVHERVKDHFARGEAIVLFSLDLVDVLWANGAGAHLFGRPVLYDLIEDGPNRNDVTFRQVEASGQQLGAPGETRQFLIRIPAGFQRIPVQAMVERIHLTGTVDAILFAAPVSGGPLKTETIARSMLEGFDDPDTHMAVLGAEGEILAQSASFAGLGLTPSTARILVGMAADHPDRLVKRPVPTGKGYLPAAIGKVSDNPAMHLLFAVETILGNMGPASGFPEDGAAPERAQAGLGDSETPAATAPDEAPVTEASEAVAESTAPDAPETGDEDLAREPLQSEADGSDEGLIESDEGLIESDEALTEALAAEIPDVSEDPFAATDEAGDEDLMTDETVAADALVADDAARADDAMRADDELATEEAAPEVAHGTGDDGDAPVSGHTAGEAVAKDISAAEDNAPAGEPQPPVQAEEPETAIEDVTGSDGFTFNPAARPTRFVWKIDATGQFSEISPELAAAVGPHAAFLSGTSFGDIAGLLDLDPDGKIAELLGRRDTWSGKTIYWPIEGTTLKAPVDLAALPTYKRNREFDGFRGFGIVRLSDAVEDPNRTGLTLNPTEPQGEAAAELEPPPAPESSPSAEAGNDIMAVPEDHAGDDRPAPSQSEAQVLEEPETGDAVADEAGEEPQAEAEPEADQPSDAEPLFEEPREEPPVFRTPDAPLRRDADKIIKLEDRRQRSRDGLTPGEQEAFREIARQLEPFRREEPEASVLSEDDEAAREEDVAETFGAEETMDETGMVRNDIDLDALRGELPDESDDDVPGLPLEPASTASESEQLEILAAYIPARTAMTGGLTGDMIDEIPVALLIHAGDRLIHANPEFLRLSGYGSLADLEAVGGLDSLLHHKELEDMPDHSGGLSLVRADDELVPVTARLQSVRWDDGNVLLLALIPSGLRQTEAPPVERDADEDHLLSRVDELQVEVEELRSILETATDGVVIIGEDGEIRSMNRSASALFDYDEAETRGKPFVMLFAHESHRAVADYLAGMTGHGVASVLNDGREVIGREASGGFIPLFMTIGKLSASNGFCAVIRDITQWKRSEEDLKAAKRAAETANAHKSDFLARVSHEIRTPLNAIIGFSDMMAIEHFGPIGHPRYVEYANDIARSGRLVLDIVNDLLDISKIEAGEMDLEFTAVELNDAVSEAVSLVQPQAHTQRVIIRTAFSDSVPDVVADLRSIKQIVLNILANAIRFTQAGGQIVVSTAYEPNGSVVLRIRDTGVGMTRSELEQAMKPFRQVTAGARKRGDGTGLGLPLTKAMVDANRASFTIQSAPNEGTLVEITFPSPRVLAN